MQELSGVKIVGHKGTWYKIDEKYWRGKKVFLMESEIWGDEAACIIIDTKCNIILEDVWNGFNDLTQYKGGE